LHCNLLLRSSKSLAKYRLTKPRPGRIAVSSPLQFDRPLSHLVRDPERGWAQSQRAGNAPDQSFRPFPRIGRNVRQIADTQEVGSAPRVLKKNRAVLEDCARPPPLRAAHDLGSARYDIVRMRLSKAQERPFPLAIFGTKRISASYGAHSQYD